MQEKPVSIQGFKGIRNVVPSERLDVADLTVGSNVDIDETGRVSRRKGTTKLVTTSAAHSLYANEDIALFVDGTALKKLDKDFSTVATLRSDLTAGLRMRYASVPKRIFFSNGLQTGCWTPAGSRTWGLAVPTSLPATTSTIGELPAGLYSYSITYVRSDGQESGAPLSGSITLTDNTGISFTAIPVSSDTDVVKKRIYISAHDSTTLYLAIELPAGTTTAVYRGYKEGVLPLLTQFKGPPPAGTVLEYYNSRIYIARDNVLWFTDAFNYELVDYRKNFIQFDDKITTIAAVEDGLFVGTESETIFLGGNSAEQLSATQVAAYGTVPGTETTLDGSRYAKGDAQGSVKGWMSTTGFCVGTSGGQMVNVSSSLYSAAQAKEGASLYKDSLTPQVVVSLFN